MMLRARITFSHVSPQQFWQMVEHFNSDFCSIHKQVVLHLQNINLNSSEGVGTLKEYIETNIRNVLLQSLIWGSRYLPSQFSMRWNILIVCKGVASCDGEIEAKLNFVVTITLLNNLKRKISIDCSYLSHPYKAIENRSLTRQP